MPAQSLHHLAWIALGSNIEPVQNLPAAVAALSASGEVLKVSSVWQSSPVGDTHQADFCNAALQVRTQLPVMELKRKLREIEKNLGRVRDPANKNAPRTIDLDIAFYDDLVCQTVELQIPDPDIPNRPFLAVPLAELDPQFHHPVNGKTLRELAEAIGGSNGLLYRDDIRL